MIVSMCLQMGSKGRVFSMKKGGNRKDILCFFCFTLNALFFFSKLFIKFYFKVVSLKKSYKGLK
jgi:hypothetical protein